MNRNRPSRNKIETCLLLVLAIVFMLNSAEERDAKIVDSTTEKEASMSGNTQGAAPVYLNHFFLVLDSQTYKEIKDAKFLQEEFATFEQRTTVRADITYTGIYFYGAHTYFEFFEPGGYNRSEGAGGIASGIEAPGASDGLKQRLESYMKAPAFKNTVTRKVGEKDIPWFYLTAVNYRNSGKLSTWLMEYHADFLSNWYPELSPKTRGITREEILERYTAKLGDNEKRKSKYLEDVVEMTLALDETEKAWFVKEREAFGYKITSGENKTVLEGPAIRYTIIPSSPSSTPIASFKMSLRRDKTGQKVYRFGSRSVLQFNDDRTATWSF
jgi:hypothetical protein